MIYGHYITDTGGNKSFFTEGCNYFRMSTGGQHESNCPCKDLKVADRTPTNKDNRLSPISNIAMVRILKYDNQGNFVKEF